MEEEYSTEDFTRMIPIGEEGAATFRTVCEVMALTVGDAERELEVSRRTASRWFGKDGPSPRAADWAEAKWDDFMSLVITTVDAICAEDEAREASGGQVDVVRLGRYRGDAAALRAERITRDEHAARIRAIFLALEVAGYRARVRYLD